MARTKQFIFQRFHSYRPCQNYESKVLHNQSVHNTEVNLFSMANNSLKNDHFDKTSEKMSQPYLIRFV